MPKEQITLEVSTDYLHRFQGITFIYDKDGFVIGTVDSTREGTIMDVIDEYEREQDELEDR